MKRRNVKGILLSGSSQSEETAYCIVTFWKRQNCGDGKKSVAGRGWQMGLTDGTVRTSRAVQLFCIVL